MGWVARPHRVCACEALEIQTVRSTHCDCFTHSPHFKTLYRLQVSKTEDWNLAVQTLGLQPGSLSRLLLRESLSL